MRIIESRRGYFRGTHKGAEIEIERDGNFGRRFYIWVRWKDGGYLYDGFAPNHVTTMAAAKREARKGACLDRRAPEPGTCGKCGGCPVNSDGICATCVDEIAVSRAAE